MKKITALLLAIVMVFCVTACSDSPKEQPEEQVNYEIAMVTDSEMIMDGGYSEVAWNTISEFGAANGISHKYYKAAEASENAYSDVIGDAVEKGAKLIVADGHSFDDVVYEAQKEYKDVKFILIDGKPTGGKNHKIKIARNTATVIFASEQAGYLAGYAAVKEGYRELGFMGNERDYMIEDYCLGFVQGADSAAQEYGVSVDVKCYFKNENHDADSIVNKAKNWYKNGTEVIFACGTDIEQPVVQAAEMQDGKVIGYETDKSGMSDTVITSAVKDITGALENVLNQYLADKFPGGEEIKYDVTNDGVGIEMDNARFDSFGPGDYRSEKTAIVEGNITVKNNVNTDLDNIDLVYVNVYESK